MDNLHNKRNLSHYSMASIFFVIASFKWFIYLSGRNYYDTNSQSLFLSIGSAVVVLLILYFLSRTKDLWARLYLIMFALFIIVGTSMQYLWQNIFNIDTMPMIEAIYYSLFCINLIFFSAVYTKTRFYIFK